MYFVETWDIDLQRFTPQIGLSPGPYTLFGLRKALRQLQTMGYMANRNDAWITVYKEGHRPKSW